MSRQLPDEVVEAYVFANTPAYLYRKLIENEYVRELAERSQSDLAEILRAARNDNIESVANAYAALIALLRKNADPTDVLASGNAKKLEWAPTLISLYKQKFIPTVVTKIRVPRISTSATDVSNAALATFSVTKVQKND